MNKRELLSYLLENNTNFSLPEILIGSGVALLLAFFQFFVYKKTYTGVKYSKSFNITLVMVTVITTMVMMIIESNLALSLGMVGALSIIRFRTAVKDPLDVAFIFWSVAIGLSCGSGIYIISVIGSIVIAIILTLLSRGKLSENVYLLTIFSSSGSSFDEIESIFKQSLKSYDLKISNTKSYGTESTYEIKFKNQSDVSKLCADLKNISYVDDVNVVSYEGLSR